MAIVSWIIVGALTGWMAGLLTGQVETHQTRSNIVAGVIGAVTGGFIMGLGSSEGIGAFTWYTYLSAVGGAMVLLAIKYFVMR